MALPKNRQAVLAILEELKPRIIGQSRPGWSCNCGAIHAGPAVAVNIDPAGDEYPGQETQWYLWMVRMSEHPDNPLDYSYGCGLSEFVEAKELDALFKRYFGPARDEEYPYHLEISGDDRVHQGLLPAVRILENDQQIRFCFDWGRRQDAAAQLDKIFLQSTQRIPAKSGEFAKAFAVLNVLDPETYIGGPEPELPFESKWRTDYAQALHEARNLATHMFFQGVGSTSVHRGNVYTHMDVVFMKVPVRD